MQQADDAPDAVGRGVEMAKTRWWGFPGSRSGRRVGSDCSLSRAFDNIAPAPFAVQSMCDVVFESMDSSWACPHDSLEVLSRTMIKTSPQLA